MSSARLLAPLDIEAEGLGPATVALLRDPRAGHEAVVVVDNVAAGPAIGGVRMSPDVTVPEVARLARAMTLKNAAAGLPHGGAKAGIFEDPSQSPAGKEQLVRWFARAIRELHDYIPGPDMGTDETCMAWIADEIGRCVGLPRTLGGIPLDEIGATGFGLSVCAEAVAEMGRLELAGARVAIQGFGAVGRHAARFLAACGMRVVAVADSTGATASAVGLDIDPLLRWKAERRTVADFPYGETMPRDEIVAVDCDVLVPAARPDVIQARNADRVKARVVLPGANLPITADAERLLHRRGVLVIPDFVANAGGVICAAVEYHGGTETQAFTTIRDRISANTTEVLRLSDASAALTPREAAERMALGRVAEAGRYRRSF